MTKMRQLSFPVLNVAFSFMILLSAQLCTMDEQLPSAGGHGCSSITPHAFSRRFVSLSPPSPLPLHAPRYFSHPKPICTASVGTYGRANILAHPVICCPVPGPTEKGKAMALRCIWTILQTWGPARRHAQFSSNLMLWLILFSQRMLIKYSITSLLAWVSYSCISSGLPTECI